MTCPLLVRLTRERATGVLVRDHGALYLADGEVVHAEAPAAPGIEVLLTASGRLGPDRWARAMSSAAPRGEVARHLVDSGELSGGELEICHLVALHDAAWFALAPGSGTGRFRYGVRHWLGRVRPVATRAVEREAERRSRALDQVWPHPGVDTAPVLRRAGAAGRRLGPRHRRLLELADGTRTPLAIAHALGRPAFHTLIDIRRLAADGVIGTPGPAALPGAAGTVPQLPVSPPLPRRAADHPGARGLPPDAPDTALLRRVRDALGPR
ncbi:transcriptional regulator [Streptomyces sp. NPDC000594]|uniref:transcriptional regulator n=1 Tax=Streptomyces sp. NPDC000594 TaxID=3154261 RepID=UPI00332681FB